MAIEFAQRFHLSRSLTLASLSSLFCLLLFVSLLCFLTLCPSLELQFFMALQLGVSTARYATHTHTRTFTHTHTYAYTNTRIHIQLHVDNAHTQLQLRLLMARTVRVVRQALGVTRVDSLSVQPGEGLPYIHTSYVLVCVCRCWMFQALSTSLMAKSWSRNRFYAILQMCYQCVIWTIILTQSYYLYRAWNNKNWNGNNIENRI